MKKNLFAILLIFFTLNALSQKDFEDEKVDIYKFGVRIIPTATGVGEYFIVKPMKDGCQIVQVLTFDSFLRQIMGKEESIANIQKKDYFQVYGINDPYIVAQLWRLRYYRYPFENFSNDTLGWTYNKANPFMPTTKQMKILSNYGLRSFSDIIFGENLFRLLKDMENIQWVENFVNAKD